VTNMENLFQNRNTFNSNISDWDTSKVTNMRGMFWGAGPFNQPLNNWNISEVANIGVMLSGTNFNQPLNNWNTSKVIVADHVFYNATKFNQNISSWDVSNVTIMANMFSSATSFNQDISNWNVSSVTNFGNYGISANAHSDNLFKTSSQYYFDINTEDITNSNISGAIGEWISTLTRATAEGKYGGHISSWDVSKVTDMNNLFKNNSFNEDISGWDVSNVTIMNNMFYNATQFNQNISGWNTAKVSNMNYMFHEASSFNQSLNSWNTAKVTTMEYMFKSATVFNQSLNSWNTSKVTFMHNMFDTATAFNGQINNWDVSKVSNMTYMFNNATVFNRTINWNISNVSTTAYMFRSARAFNNNGDAGINNWDVSKVSDMTQMFYYADSFNQPLNNWNVSKVSTMATMFDWAKAFNQSLNNWSVSNVSNMQGMFQTNTAFNGDISDWDISKVTNISYMFKYATAFNQDISGWNTSKVSNFYHYGNNASLMPTKFKNSDLYGYFQYQLGDSTALSSAINAWISNSSTAEGTYGNPSNWDVSKVTDMSGLFEDVTFSEDISNWDVSNVQNMQDMFEGCTFNGDISNWNTSKVQNMQDMFKESTFNGDISNWNVSKVTTMESMFKGNASFNNGGDSWNVSNVKNMKKMFNNATSFNQDIGGWNVSQVTTISNMFENATSFDQDLRFWPVGNVSSPGSYGLNSGHSDSTYFSSSDPSLTYFYAKGRPFSNTDLQHAVQSWLSDSTAAENIYGDISDWNTSEVTDMEKLFHEKTFNEDISDWDVTNVTTIRKMFKESTFNRNITDWNLANVDLTDGLEQYGESSSHSDSLFTSSDKNYFNVLQVQYPHQILIRAGDSGGNRHGSYIMNMVFKYTDGTVEYVAPSAGATVSYNGSGYSAQRQYYNNNMWRSDGLVCFKRGGHNSEGYKDHQFFNYTLSGELDSIYFMYHTGDDGDHGWGADSTNFCFNWNPNITYAEQEHHDYTAFNAARNHFGGGGYTFPGLFGYAKIEFNFENMQFKLKHTASYYGEFRNNLAADGRDGSYPMYNYYLGRYPESDWTTINNFPIERDGYNGGWPNNGGWHASNGSWTNLTWTHSDYQTNGQDWTQ